MGYGLYYGGIGLGKGIAYTGRAIGRGLAYPFNRPPKPMRVPTTWEQYKHDVIKLQKRLTKADKSNKANQRWCVSRVPLSASANRSEWEARCNPGDAVSRAALPPDVLAPPAPTPVLDSPASSSSTPPAVPVSTTDEAVTPPPAVAEEAAALPVAAPPAGDPATAAPDAPSPAVDTAPAQDLAQQKEVQTGVAPAKTDLDPAGGAPTPPLTALTPFEKASAGFADGKVAISGTTPAPLSQGQRHRALPSETPANSLTPSEYGFEGRNGYAVKFNQVWGPATPAEKLIERWNVIPPIEAMQKKVRELAIAEGTEYSKKTIFERAREAVLDAIKRVRGSAAIVDRAKETQGGRTAYANYAKETLDQGIGSMQLAADGHIDQALDSSDEQEKSLQRLQHGTVETVMGQVGDPAENLKDAALAEAKENFPLSMPKNRPIRQASICHTSDPLGIGCAKAKLIYSPPR